MKFITTKQNVNVIAMQGSQEKFRHGDWCSHCKHYNEKAFRKSDCVCICHE